MNAAARILAQGEPEASAVVYRDTVLAYGELRRQVVETAHGLIDRGHRQGDRIGILSENSPFFVVSYFGIIRAGLVAVPLQTDLSDETFAKIFSDAGLNAVFVSKRFWNRVRQWARKLEVELMPEDGWLTAGSGAGNAPVDIDANGGSDSLNLKSDGRSGVEQQPDRICSNRPASADRLPSDGQGVAEHNSRLASLMFTSGSTGTPKGVMITHGNIECNTRDIISYMGLTSADRVMVVLPFHYCFGLSLLHTHLMAGGAVVLNNDFRLYPEAVLKELQQKECTGIAGVPSTYQILLRKSRFRQMSFPKLRWFQQAGGKLPNACIEEVRAAFPQIKYYLMYGQTEATARLSYLPPERLTDKLGSIGRGLPSGRLEVLAPDGTPVEASSDEIGEIVASGDNIALGYWKDPAESAKFFRDGKLYTGDLARVDAEGFIFIVERERDMIKSGGNRVSAKEVEDAIAEIPEVVEVAVVGVLHDLLGEAIRAFVVPHPKANLSETEVLMHCRQRLPVFKNPENVVLVKSLPHNSAGKVLKQELKRNCDDYAALAALQRSDRQTVAAPTRAD